LKEQTKTNQKTNHTKTDAKDIGQWLNFGNLKNSFAMRDNKQMQNKKYYHFCAFMPEAKIVFDSTGKEAYNYFFSSQTAVMQRLN
jgi:hypothetical protein